MLRYLILGLLRHESARHGYALMKDYKEGSGREISIGNFYREFQRLQAEGLVRPASNPPDADPRRIPYGITEVGSAEFDDWLSRPVHNEFAEQEDGYSLRAFFAVKDQPAAAERILGHWEDELRLRRRVLECAREDALARRGKNGQQETLTLPLWLGRRLKHLAVDLEFIQELRAARDRSVATGRGVTPDKRPRAAEGRPTTNRGGRLPHRAAQRPAI